jgi:hypothetical protein
LTWKDREKLEVLQEDERTLKELDDWEQNTLKEANPNYRDPDKFFENLEN